MTKLEPIRTNQQSLELAHAVLTALAEGRSAGKTVGAIGGFLANMVGPIPPERWEAMQRDAARPCDDPGCDCHTVAVRVFDALDDLRGDWIAYRDKSTVRRV